MVVSWTQEALERLEDIYHYLAVDQQAPEAALAMINAVLSRETQLSEMPESGRIVPDYQNPHIRELLESPYRIIYGIADDGINILSVMHQSQLLPKVNELNTQAEALIKKVDEP